MPYTPKTWADGPAGATPILAADLNHLELGLKAASPTYNVKDPAFGAVGNGVTDDTAAIQAAITAAINNGVVVIPAGQYIISAPLEVLGAVQIQGGDARASVIIASGSFSGNQMIRNWVAADWQSGETNHRIHPSNPTFSGTHSISPYARIRDIGLNLGGVSNLAGFSWVGPNETTLLKNLVIASGTASTSNLGMWGIDIQGAVIGPKGEDIVFYGSGGWERQLSVDASASSGLDAFFENITFSPMKLWHSRCYVNNVDNFALRSFHMETTGGADAGAHGYIYLVSHTGFGSYSIRDGSILQNASTTKPFIQHDNDQTGNMTRITAPVVDRVKIAKTVGTWTGNFIVDQYNSFSLTGAIGAQSAPAIEVIHRYDGSCLVWTNTDGSRGVHYYKNPDGLVTSLNVRDYGAVGDGTTDDTAAIQAALDAAGLVQGTVFLPPPASAYLVSNLKMVAQTRLIGSGMSSCTLQQKTGATGIVLREKTVAEGNATGAAGIWVTDLRIIGNNVAGNGLDLGNQTGGQLNLNAGVERVFVQNFPAGTGININGNAIRCAYLWSNLNATGITTSGGANSWVGLWAEANTTEDIHIGTSGDSYFHLQTESIGGTNLPINITANDNVIVRPYISIGANATQIIQCSTGSNRNHIIGAYLSTGGFTFSNLIYSQVLSLGTGSGEFHIPEWFGEAPVQKPRRGEADATYSSSITVDLNASDKHYIPVTNTTAFTINAPLSVEKGYRLMLNIKNNSGGVMGVVTWDAVFKLAGAFTNPANTKQRNIEFYYDGGNWVETNRSAADI